MAAITDFSERKENIENTNVVGTKNIVTLSRDTDAPLSHVSKAYVYDFPNANRFCKKRNFYEISKRLDEKIVKDSLVKATIIRHSIIFGDSHHGTVSTLQGYHLLSRLIME
ncbi:dTDP-4-dehydrorhamnose reductase [Bacillus alveayuensis]|uniref:dTDP-4-dehydrorhamnose reductase n=2 Tax=Aeribacillus alveayuensis TaxID=279215 RepID=A0ABT9VSX1_9BACI|nr:dTDP-4-dehydrorhamnose reductase [Bacillus alveayuensis]